MIFILLEKWWNQRSLW